MQAANKSKYINFLSDIGKESQVKVVAGAWILGGWTETESPRMIQTGFFAMGFIASVRPARVS